MNNKFWVFIIICLLMFSSAYGSNANALNYGAEFLGASVSDFIISVPFTTVAVLSWLAGFGETSNGFGIAAISGLSGYIISSSVGTPLGAVLTSKILHCKGNTKGAYFGGLIGTGLGLVTVWTYNKVASNWQDCLPVINTALILPPLCSVIGYNLSSHKDNSHSMFNRNIPQIGVTVLPEKHDDKISPKIGANITFRF